MDKGYKNSLKKRSLILNDKDSSQDYIKLSSLYELKSHSYMPK